MSAVQKLKDFLALGNDSSYLPEDGYLSDEREDYDQQSRHDYMDRSLPPQRPSYDQYVPPVRRTPSVVEVPLARYEQAATVGAPYRDNNVVVISMKGMSRDDARRVVDFAAGLVYALRGEMEKLDSRTFVLRPEGVSMSVTEVMRAVERR